MDVITLTGNLLAEWSFSVEQIKLGTTQRANSMSFQVGGKGINVSRVLQRLGTTTEAYAFAEGPLADLCSDSLDEESIEHKFFPLGSDVRPGLVVNNGGGASTETTYLGKDQIVPESSWIAALKRVNTERPLLLAICGSIPGWQKEWLIDIRDMLEHGKIRICVDTYGPPLKDLITVPLDLVKINRSELVMLFGGTGEESTLDMLAEISSTSPVRNWIITDSANPILAAFENGEVYNVIPAKIEQVSPTGSGDTFLAALASDWVSEFDPAQILSHASACATANAARADVGKFELPVSEEYLPEVRQL